jgi:hypothetical protein
VIGVGLYAFYKWYVEEVNFWDAVPCGRHLEHAYLIFKETLLGKGKHNQQDERSLPDEDDGKVGFNVHTNYGSI